MRQKRQVARQWARSLSGGLAVLTLLLSLASVSPAIHEWLHVADHCESHCGNSSSDESSSNDREPHICGVTLLNLGATSPIAIVLPMRADLISADLSIDVETLWCGQAPLQLSARAPPIETVV